MYVCVSCPRVLPTFRYVNISPSGYSFVRSFEDFVLVVSSFGRIWEKSYKFTKLEFKYHVLV